MDEVIFRDGSTVLTYSNRTGLAIPIIPNIPMKIVLTIPDTPECDTPYLSFHLQQADDPAGPWEVLISTPSWSFHRNPAKCPPYILIPHIYEANIQPTKAYMRDVYGLPTAAPNSAGYLALIATYEVMPTAVYDFLMGHKPVLEAKAATKTRGKSQLTDKLAEATGEEAAALATLGLYNYFSDEIAQYEALNP